MQWGNLLLLQGTYFVETNCFNLYWLVVSHTDSILLPGQFSSNQGEAMVHVATGGYAGYAGCAPNPTASPNLPPPMSSPHYPSHRSLHFQNSCHYRPYNSNERPPMSTHCPTVNSPHYDQREAVNAGHVPAETFIADLARKATQQSFRQPSIPNQVNASVHKPDILVHCNFVPVSHNREGESHNLINGEVEGALVVDRYVIQEVKTNSTSPKKIPLLLDRSRYVKTYPNKLTKFVRTDNASLVAFIIPNLHEDDNDWEDICFCSVIAGNNLLRGNGGITEIDPFKSTDGDKRHPIKGLPFKIQKTTFGVQNSTYDHACMLTSTLITSAMTNTGFNEGLSPWLHTLVLQSTGYDIDFTHFEVFQPGTVRLFKTTGFTALFAVKSEELVGQRHDQKPIPLRQDLTDPNCYNGMFDELTRGITKPFVRTDDEIAGLLTGAFEKHAIKTRADRRRNLADKPETSRDIVPMAVLVDYGLKFEIQEDTVTLLPEDVNVSTIPLEVVKQAYSRIVIVAKEK